MRSPDPALTVHKFGGAALADAAAIRRVTSIVAQDTAPQKLVVASAMLGVTDELLGVENQTQFVVEGGSAELLDEIETVARRSGARIIERGSPRTSLEQLFLETTEDPAQKPDG